MGFFLGKMVNKNRSQSFGHILSSFFVFSFLFFVVILNRTPRQPTYAVYVGGVSIFYRNFYAVPDTTPASVN